MKSVGWGTANCGIDRLDQETLYFRSSGDQKMIKE